MLTMIIFLLSLGTFALILDNWGINIMFDKYDFIIKVCGLVDNAPDFTETMPDDEYNYYKGYVKALLDVTDIFDEFNK